MRNKRKLKALARDMANSENYADWLGAARDHDDLTGMTDWRHIEHTDLYDYAQIRLRLDRLRNLRARSDHQGLLYALNEGIHGNMGGMGGFGSSGAAKRAAVKAATTTVATATTATGAGPNA